MTPVVGVIVAVLTTVLAAVVAVLVRDRRRRASPMRTSARRILFPFAEHALSRRALDAALRLARADDATLVPVFLARVPLHVPLDAPLPRQCGDGMPLLETIEQRASGAGVPVDARIGRGRTYRHALREVIAQERYDRLIVAASAGPGDGFRGDDIAWLLDNAPGEIVIVRPGTEDRLEPRRPPRVRMRRTRVQAAPEPARPEKAAVA